jgi:hypothetical protein
VGLERGPLGLVSTTEELLEIKSSGSGLERRDYGRRDPSRRPRGTLYLQTLALTSLTSGGRSRTQVTEFSLSQQLYKKAQKTPWSESASELYKPNDRHLSAKLMPKFVDRGCHVVNVMDPHARILGFLGRTQLYTVNK